ncbi:MAG: molybdopterin-dependent oxidoreductase, partial [Nitrospirales bacterium]|nr:molybdopterin-dependent oxidoreductase [Nitrospirales bacterium]
MGAFPAGDERETRGLIGRSVPRVDGMEKAEGRTLFVDDLRPEGLLYGKVIRTGIAKGRLKTLRFLDGIDWTSFVIVTAQDIPGRNIHKLHRDDQVYLVEREISHKGEAIALIAHPSQASLREAERFIEVGYEEELPILTLDESLRRGEALCELRIERGAVDEAFGNSEYKIIEGEYRTGHQEHLYLETQGMIAQYRDGRLKVTGSMQCPFYVKDALDSLMAMDVEVEQLPTGGGFGGKEEYPSMIAGYAALLAWKAAGIVKLVYDRREDMLYTTKRHPSITRYRTACAPDGKIMAQDMEVILDGGAESGLAIEPGYVVIDIQAIDTRHGPWRGVG